MTSNSTRRTILLISIIVVLFYYCWTTFNFQHTKVFNVNYKNNNDKRTFFDERTFGYKLYNNPCERIKYNDKFRKYVNRQLRCTGKWCSGNTFNCPNGNRMCYHVEHIIDKNGPEFASDKCNKNIAGNLVMAHGEWNMALGGIAKNDYWSSMNEKSIVYGKDAMNKARKLIKKCNPGCANIWD